MIDLLCNAKGITMLQNYREELTKTCYIFENQWNLLNLKAFEFRDREFFYLRIYQLSESSIHW